MAAVETADDARITVDHAAVRDGEATARADVTDVEAIVVVPLRTGPGNEDGAVAGARVARADIAVKATRYDSTVADGQTVVRTGLPDDQEILKAPTRVGPGD